MLYRIGLATILALALLAAGCGGEDEPGGNGGSGGTAGAGGSGGFGGDGGGGGSGGSGGDGGSGGNGGSGGSTEPVCGDGVIEGDEECEGDDFGGKTCADFGHNAGSLSCDGCRIDASACQTVEICDNDVDDDGDGSTDCDDDDCAEHPACQPGGPVCGNGVLEQGEQCDGGVPDGMTCADVGNFNSGTLACNLDTCQLVTDGCALVELCDVPGDEDGNGVADCDDEACEDHEACQPVCGNGIREEGEECDGGVPDGITCADVGNFNSGTLACNLDTCQLVTDGCALVELCDVPGDEDGNGAADCDDPACAAHVACLPVCGDGLVEGDEECDVDVPAGMTCSTAGNFNGGTLACTNCRIDTSGCTLTEFCDQPGDEDGNGLADCDDPACADFVDCLPVCGDGIVEGAEECDPDLPVGLTCADVGNFNGGTLACTNCRIDTSGCTLTEFCDQPGDEDGNGLADCNDPACADYPACLPPTCDNPADINAGYDEATGTWHWAGDTTNMPSNHDAMDCSARDSEAVGRFAAPTSGRYRFELSTNYDGVLHLRAICGVRESEITCADSYWSGVETATVFLTSGEEIFVFADGYDADEPDSGPFTVTVTQLSECGNGVVEDGERCDIGPDGVGNGCDERCQIEEGWTCDETGCWTTTCGDGIVEGQEQCDGGPACNEQCRLRGNTCDDPLWLDENFELSPGVWWFEGDTRLFDETYNAQSCAPTGGNRDMVLAFTAPADGSYLVEYVASYDRVLYIWDGVCGPEATKLACTDSAPERATLNLVAGQTVYIVADGYGSTSGDTDSGPFTMVVTQVRDLSCDSPADITAAWDEDLAAWVWRGTTRGQANHTGSSTIACGSSTYNVNLPDAVGRFVAPESGRYFVNQLTSGWDGVLYVWQGTCGDPASQIACQDDPSQVILDLVQGDEVFVVVDGWGTSFTGSNQGIFALVVVPVICGDGRLTGDEECDYGDTQDGDGCSSSCRFEPGWICDETHCRQPVCGDGVVEGDEQCDFGDAQDGDGCSSSCQIEPGWSCDATHCWQPVCGDGIVEGDEQCDDPASPACDAQCRLVVFEIPPMGEALTLQGSITATDPLFQRPVASCTSLSPTGPQYYDVWMVTNPGPSAVTIEIRASWVDEDGFLLVYPEDFDFDVATTGCLAGNDDDGGASASRISSLQLQPGQTVAVVATTFYERRTMQSYTLTIQVTGN